MDLTKSINIPSSLFVNMDPGLNKAIRNISNVGIVDCDGCIAYLKILKTCAIYKILLYTCKKTPDTAIVGMAIAK